MRLKPGIIIANRDGYAVAIDSGISGERFGGMVKLNETALFITEKLQNGARREEICECLCNEYDVTHERAMASVDYTVAQLSKAGIIQQD
ncbi:MAG: PqqD family protein [Clostridiales bacterium]|nr:PqqD family protein [Clostridiales bacterium]